MEEKAGAVTEISEMGEGSRVEVDFIDLLGPDEGILVGDSARGFVRVLAETRRTGTYPPRPFRVNAGAVHQYIYMGNDRTKYLSELEAGDRVPVVSVSGTRMVAVGRVKIEKRPFIRITLENGVSATLQEADSVFVAATEGALHLVEIKKGDCLWSVVMEAVARHKGEVVEEAIIEK